MNEKCFHLVGSPTSSKYAALVTAIYRGPKDFKLKAELDIIMFWKTKLNMMKCESTQHFKSIGEIFGHGTNAQFDIKEGASFGHYYSKNTKLATRLEKHCNKAMAEY
eukprot:10547245-Ditylum_brightwellii.AAC.1